MKAVPRQRSGSGNSIEIPMKRRSARMRAKDGGALPDTGCPMSRWQGSERHYGHGADKGDMSYNTSIHSRTVISVVYTFEASVSRRTGSMGRSGTFGPWRRKKYRCSQGTCRSGRGVVVHGKRSGTRRLVKTQATVVVHDALWK